MHPALILIGGLLLFGVLFAVNSSLHSYLIVSYAGSDGVSLDVGFYYMANAMGRLIGTVLSGWVFQLAGQGATGLAACLWISGGMLVATVIISLGLPKRAHHGPQEPEHQEKTPQCPACLSSTATTPARHICWRSCWQCFWQSISSRQAPNALTMPCWKPFT